RSRQAHDAGDLASRDLCIHTGQANIGTGFRLHGGFVGPLPEHLQRPRLVASEDLVDAIDLDLDRIRGKLRRPGLRGIRGSGYVAGHLPSCCRMAWRRRRGRPYAWVMRSKMIANITMATPACRPRPTSSVCMPASTSSPSPRAPIMDATTTM